MERMEAYFTPFREQIIGYQQTFHGPYGEKRIVYADWTASGRLYAPIERKLIDVFGPFVGNTHSESSVTGASMTRAYHRAHAIIKEHVNAGPNDVIITAGFGMTAVVNKLQRMLGLKLPDQLQPLCSIPQDVRPVVFVTHMEHHSNHTTWLETIADVECVEPDEQGLVSCDRLRELLERYKHRALKIGSFTACSNVTGIRTPYHQLARIMHEYGGYCFIDFSASAPYVAIDMHPADPMEKLDAIFFSPHKFLGGPGASGVLIFDSALYNRKVPDHPGGGTVAWTNPWKEHRFVTNIEAREDGGTPGFLQAIKAALAIQLKEAMGVDCMQTREQELLQSLFKELRTVPGLHILADHIDHRLGIVSFYVDNIHYNLLVKILNDRFGIQVRGGCACAGTYGHYLLHIDQQRSRCITDKIDRGDLSEKPGWVRLSIHPTTTIDEVYYIIDALWETVKHIETWEKEYVYASTTNEFRHRRMDVQAMPDVNAWFSLR
jgi:selenocysteine lyase/cysteine desulfurase